MTFKVIESARKATASIGDRYLIEDGIRTVRELSKIYVHLDNGYKFYRKEFNRWMRIENAMVSKIRTIKAKKANVKVVEKTVMGKINSFEPSRRWRYIVVQNYDTHEYKWIFAQKPTSHSEMEQEFHLTDGENWRAAIGGFYFVELLKDAKIISNDEHTWEIDQHRLHLYGESGSFGCYKEGFIEALPFLKLKHTEIDYSLMDKVWDRK